MLSGISLNPAQKNVIKPTACNKASHPRCQISPADWTEFVALRSRDNTKRLKNCTKLWSLPKQSLQKTTIGCPWVCHRFLRESSTVQPQQDRLFGFQAISNYIKLYQITSTHINLYQSMYIYIYILIICILIYINLCQPMSIRPFPARPPAARTTRASHSQAAATTTPKPSPGNAWPIAAPSINR